MDESSKILSTEEVDALSKVSQESENDLSKIINNAGVKTDKDYIISTKIITNILELTWTEAEKALSTFIKTKVNVQYKDCTYIKLSEYLASKTEKYVYSIFNINESPSYCMIMTPMPLLHQVLNCLYGGTVNPNEPIIENPGKIGAMVSEGLATLSLEAFAIACKEYKKISFNKYKTFIISSLLSKIELDGAIYALTYTVAISDSISEIIYVFPENFIDGFVPIESLNDGSSHQGNALWHDLIKSQLIDSEVTLVAALPKVPITTHDLLELKVGDSIPISDPTFVDVCLNNIKVCSGIAAQANEARIIKVLGEN